MVKTQAIMAKKHCFRRFLGGEPGVLRKALRTLRKGFPSLAQALRSPFYACLCLSILALNRPAAAATASHFEWSGDRYFIFDPARQTFKVGTTLHELSDWHSLPNPPGVFHGMRMRPGPKGHVFILDEAQPRLCLFDTAGQWLSCLPLPDDLQHYPARHLEWVARKDGRFIFFDSDAGKAWIYREERPGEAQTRWRLLSTTHLTPGLRACIERPWFDQPCCLRNGQVKCFDAFLNPVSLPEAEPPTSKGQGFQAYPDSTGRHWIFRLPGASGDSATACYSASLEPLPCP